MNAPKEQFELFAAQEEIVPPTITPPVGCVPDLEPSKGEHRRVTFLDEEPKDNIYKAEWSIKTEIVHPPKAVGRYKEKEFKPDDSKTVARTPFEAYERKDHSIDWGEGEGNHLKHVCIHLDHKGSHKQLWVLRNDTGALHNFHIHQMKFRLATRQDLYEHNIIPPDPAHTCASSDNPEYKLYEDSSDPKPIWHDTIPVPPESDGVFVVMSFDAAQQVGRFVFHCHILKHEDKGLMAPIEVWGASAASVDR